MLNLLDYRRYKMELDKITEALCVFADYIDRCIPPSRERDTVLNKLQEAVFWITYINEEV